ncbi:hypothetical protein V4F39_03045 [Aquincola sp. MAHUQ-54]|uniref:Uncharacterized protein n=1 Tax=Aquincola agrisoli TaxID=3119538 RepID=A0AAW9QCA2_9BURK
MSWAAPSMEPVPGDPAASGVEALPGCWVLSPAEQLRAARRLQRLQRERAALPVPRPLPLLFVPGVGATRLALHDGAALWDPDAAALPDGGEGAAKPWRQPVRVLSDHGADPCGAQGAALVAAAHRLPASARAAGLGALPPLGAALQARYQALKDRGWTALLQAYWPLAERLQAGDSTLVPISAHAFGWDWRSLSAATVERLRWHVARLLERTGAPALVLLAEGAGQSLVQQALHGAAGGHVLAVYVLDAVAPLPAAAGVPWVPVCRRGAGPRPPGGAVASFGLRRWQAMAAGHPGLAPDVPECLGGNAHMPAAEAAPALLADTLPQACNGLLRDAALRAWSRAAAGMAAYPPFEGPA